MRARDKQKFKGEIILTAHRDLADFCFNCGKDILKGQTYIKEYKGLRHYTCKENKLGVIGLFL